MKMMQKSLLALAVLATTAMNVQAASSVDLKVIGSIDPGTCTPSLSGSGTVDYGTISPSSLELTGLTVLPQKNIDFEINCTAPTKVAIKAINGRPNTTAGTTSDIATGVGRVALPVKGFTGFTTVEAPGLGLSGTDRVGGYEIGFVVNSSKLDSKSVDQLYSPNVSSNTWIKETMPNSSFFFNAQSNTVTWATTGEKTPLSFTTMTGKIAVRAFINDRSNLNLKNIVKMDGLTTLELVYLP